MISKQPRQRVLVLKVCKQREKVGGVLISDFGIPRREDFNTKQRKY
jgi:hypothetical protein